ncbi:MAG TPA: HAD-IA family hydrolase [Cyclobacteriaceae bacterium]|nr:HAD-IA family hydrolase [Cyclobacteriaceae bacterium]
MKKLPTLIVFDLAGTTVEDRRDVHRTLRHALAQFGVSISMAEANAVMGIPKPVAIEQLLKANFHPDITPELIGEIHETFVKEMIKFYREDHTVQEKKGAWETFQRLKLAGIKIAVDTGFDRQITNPLLERMGWMPALVDFSVTSDEVKQGRPHPDLIFRAMELAGVKDASSVMKVGDTVSDIEEGKSAGCGWVVGITSGAFTRTELAAHEPTHLIHELKELLVLLELD